MKKLVHIFIAETILIILLLQIIIESLSKNYMLPTYQKAI